MIEFKGDISKETKKLIRRLDLSVPLFAFGIPVLALFVFILMPIYSLQQFARTLIENLGLYVAVFAVGVATIVVSYQLPKTFPCAYRSPPTEPSRRTARKNSMCMK